MSHLLRARPVDWRDNVFQTVFDIFLWKGCVSVAMLLGKRQHALLKGCLPGGALWRGEASTSPGAKEPRAQECWPWAPEHSWSPDVQSCSPASAVACGKHPGGKSDLKIVKKPSNTYENIHAYMCEIHAYLQEDDIEEAEPFPGQVWSPAMHPSTQPLHRTLQHRISQQTTTEWSPSFLLYALLCPKIKFRWDSGCTGAVFSSSENLYMVFPFRTGSKNQKSQFFYH